VTAAAFAIRDIKISLYETGRSGCGF
jgi:hypothetical protein